MPSGARRLLTRPWIGPLAVLTVVFLAFSLPPYLSLHPSQSRTILPPGYPWYYPMLVTHIFFGSVALLTACLQVWPWLRRRHPQVHRWSGRIYVFAGALPAAVVVLTITPFGVWGRTSRPRTPCWGCSGSRPLSPATAPPAGAASPTTVSG